MCVEYINARRFLHVPRLRLMAFSLVFLFTLNLPSPASAQSTTIVATIQPVRFVIVDKNNLIISIYSNSTAPQVSPHFLQDSLNGKKFTPSETLEKQYQLIVAQGKWQSNAGEIYRRPDPLTSKNTSCFISLCLVSTLL